MINRTLVPRDVKPVNRDELKKNGSRVSTYMDDRTVVPAGPSDAPPLNGKSNIPEHLPLDVLVDRILVPRGMAIKPIERSVESQAKGAMALEVLDARLVVPAHIKPLEPEQELPAARPLDTAALRQVVEPDIFITGDANLLIESEEKHDSKWDNLARIGSIAAHIVLILLLVNLPKIFSSSTPSAVAVTPEQKEISMLYLPPEQAPRPPAPKMPRIDPKMLERMAPPVEKPLVPEPTPPPPQPVKPKPDLPEAPTPHVATPQPPPPQQPPQQLAQNTPPPQPQSQLEPIKPSSNHLNLQLPNESPGQVLQQQEQDAIKRHGPGVYIPNDQGPSGQPGHGPPGRNAVNILTPTQGVDFNPYIQRMLNTIYRNWVAVMPQSAMLGDKGVVYITFQINPDGSVQPPDPQMERTSSKPPLDTAAMSSIRASNPFEPLPKEFHGPYMRFGIFFLYNLPVDYLNNH
ncbi:MAG TPA: TonB C-terminal domain-containing protein [Candidatus Acidoferrales bacterium]